MADYTLTCETGVFNLTGNAASAKYSLQCEPGVFRLNPPRDVSQIALPPKVGTFLYWRKADGTYYVVINQV